MSLDSELYTLVQSQLPLILPLILGDHYLLDIGEVDTTGSDGLRTLKYRVSLNIAVFRMEQLGKSLVKDFSEWAEVADEVVYIILYKDDMSATLANIIRESETLEDNPFVEVSRHIQIDDLKGKIISGEIQDTSGVLDFLSSRVDHHPPLEDISILCFKKQNAEGIPYKIWVRLQMRNGTYHDSGGVDIWDALRHLHANLSVG